MSSRVTSSAERSHRNADPAIPDPSDAASCREVWTGARRGALRARRLALAVPSLGTAGGLVWLAALAYPASVSRCWFCSAS